MTDQEDDLSRCMAIVSPLLPDLYAAWETAHRKYREEYPAGVLAEHTDSVAATCVRQHQLIEVERRFGLLPGVMILDVRGLKVINYKDQAVLRLKKLDRYGRHRNYQTKQQKEFDGQEPLPGLPEAAARLTSGYQLDAAGEFIERHIIARPIGKSIAWTAQVHMDADEVVTWTDITPRRFVGFDRFDFRRRQTGE